MPTRNRTPFPVRTGRGAGTMDGARGDGTVTIHSLRYARIKRRMRHTDDILDGAIVFNVRYGNKGERKWLVVHRECTTDLDRLIALERGEIDGYEKPILGPTDGAKLTCARCNGQILYLSKDFD